MVDYTIQLHITLLLFTAVDAIWVVEIECDLGYDGS